VAYSIQVEKMTDEDREQFDGQIGMTEDPEQTAKDALRKFQQEHGIEFEDPDAPVTPEPGAMDENYG
jgi:hypothetical protein